MKKLLAFFKEPPLWFLLLLAVLAVGGAVGGTLFLTQESLSAYVAAGYVFLGVMGASAGYCVYGFIKTFPDLNGRVMKWSEGKPFWGRLFREYGFRTILFALFSFLINTAFAVYNGVIAALNGSAWFGALAGYYGLLIVLRGVLLLYHAARRKRIRRGQTEEETRRGDVKIYMACGGLLILLPAALSAVIACTVSGEAFVHTGLTIYAYAAYAFTKAGFAIYHFVKTQRSDEMTVRAAKHINLADAFVSILALQTAMFHEFGGGGIDVPMMNAVTGAVVCALTAALGIFMIAVAARKLRKNAP